MTKPPPMGHLTIRLAPALRLRIKVAAAAERRSEGSWIRNALEDRVQQQRSTTTQVEARP
jgi:predicted HicB family RNase H-like nuclease